MLSYPPGCRTYFPPQEQVLSCPRCKHEWTTQMYWELGGWFLTNDNDAYCPACADKHVESEGEPA